MNKRGCVNAADMLHKPSVGTDHEFRLWPGDAPGALGSQSQDIPTLAPFFPEPGNPTGAAVIVCPGGGYGGLAPHEGELYARWLNELGIAAFVLKYRLGSHGYRHPSMMQDAQRAIRYVRAHAAQWQIDHSRVGIMGSSAGGHLAATALTHFEASQMRPIRSSARVAVRISAFFAIR